MEINIQNSCSSLIFISVLPFLFSLTQSNFSKNVIWGLSGDKSDISQAKNSETVTEPDRTNSIRDVMQIKCIPMESTSNRAIEIRECYYYLLNNECEWELFDQRLLEHNSFNHNSNTFIQISLPNFMATRMCHREYSFRTNVLFHLIYVKFVAPKISLFKRIYLRNSVSDEYRILPAFVLRSL